MAYSLTEAALGASRTPISRTMRSSLLFAAAFALGCGAPATRTPPLAAPPPITPAATADACAPDLGWLDEANQLRVELARTGHTGIWTVYLRLFADAESGAFEGVAVAAFQRRPSEAPRAKSVAVKLSRAQVTPLLALLRESVEARPQTSTAPKTFVADTDRTEWRTVDIARDFSPRAPGTRPPPSRHTQLYTDATDVRGPEWMLRGCARPSHASMDLRARIVAAYDALLAAAGATALVDTLVTEAGP